MNKKILGLAAVGAVVALALMMRKSSSAQTTSAAGTAGLASAIGSAQSWGGSPIVINATPLTAPAADPAAVNTAPTAQTVPTKPAAATEPASWAVGPAGASQTAAPITLSSGLPLQTGGGDPTGNLKPGDRGTNPFGVSYVVQPNGSVIYGV